MIPTADDSDSLLMVCSFFPDVKPYLMIGIQTFWGKKVLQKAFDMFDRDKTGSIATTMMSTILRTLGQTFEESDLEMIVGEIDADGESEILLFFIY